MALYFTATSDYNLAHTIRSTLISVTKEQGGRLYNDFKEARMMYRKAIRVGRLASRNVVIGFVDPSSEERAREVAGKFAYDASVTCASTHFFSSVTVIGLIIMDNDWFDY